jgi:hypothetical protein
MLMPLLSQASRIASSRAWSSQSLFSGGGREHMAQLNPSGLVVDFISKCLVTERPLSGSDISMKLFFRLFLLVYYKVRT